MFLKKWASKRHRICWWSRCLQCAQITTTWCQGINDICKLSLCSAFLGQAGNPCDNLVTSGIWHLGLPWSCKHLPDHAVTICCCSDIVEPEKTLFWKKATWDFIKIYFGLWTRMPITLPLFILMLSFLGGYNFSVIHLKKTCSSLWFSFILCPLWMGVLFIVKWNALACRLFLWHSSRPWISWTGPDKNLTYF